MLESAMYGYYNVLWLIDVQTTCTYIHVHACVSEFLYLVYACNNISCSGEEAAFELFFTENLVHAFHIYLLAIT